MLDTAAACRIAAATAAAEEDGDPTEDDTGRGGGGKLASCENGCPPGDGVADAFGDEEEPIVMAEDADLEDVALPGVGLLTGDGTDDFCE